MRGVKRQASSFLRIFTVNGPVALTLLIPKARRLCDRYVNPAQARSTIC